jgi:hypothetical protein
MAGQIIRRGLKSATRKSESGRVSWRYRTLRDADKQKTGDLSANAAKSGMAMANSKSPLVSESYPTPDSANLDPSLQIRFLSKKMEDHPLDNYLL